jgi:hypothetical protein
MPELVLQAVASLCWSRKANHVFRFSFFVLYVYRLLTVYFDLDTFFVVFKFGQD